MKVWSEWNAIYHLFNIGRLSLSRGRKIVSVLRCCHWLHNMKGSLKTKGHSYEASQVENDLHKWYIVYTDNFYTSPELCNDLLELKTFTTGIVLTNRKHFFTVLLTVSICQREETTSSFSQITSLSNGVCAHRSATRMPKEHPKTKKEHRQLKRPTIFDWTSSRSLPVQSNKQIKNHPGIRLDLASTSHA